MFKICCSEPILCVVVYCPPYSNADFLPEFSDFMSYIVLNYDKVIIAGDFNIHIDDLSNRFASEFLNITESFNLVQYVFGPTHKCGHTIDLVFTLGLNVSSVIQEDAVISDHCPIIFDAQFPCQPVNPCVPARSSRLINPCTTITFANAYAASACTHSLKSPPVHLSAEKWSHYLIPPVQIF